MTSAGKRVPFVHHGQEVGCDEDGEGRQEDDGFRGDSRAAPVDDRGDGQDDPGREYHPDRIKVVVGAGDPLIHCLRLAHHSSMGAALLRRRPNQSLRQRGRRQLDPSRRGEGAAEGTGGRWYLCRQRRLGVFRWYSRAWWRVSVRINAPAARGGLRTVATAAKCHRAPVDSHPVAGQMPTGLQ